MKKTFVAFVAGALITAIPTSLAVSGAFSDVKEDSWYADAVENLKQSDIIHGYPDGSYQPEEYVNRAELAVIIDEVIQQERAFNQACDQLSVFQNHSWFPDLNEKYKAQKNFLSQEGQNIAIEEGEGCLVGRYFIVKPGQFADGCFEFFAYNIDQKELTHPDSPYCIDHFTGINTDKGYLSFVGQNGPLCHETQGKYYYQENHVEANTQPCE